MPAYALHPQVGLREERFGALAYHYGNRRLTFLNDAVLVDIVRHLGDYDDLETALDAAHVDARRRPAYRRAIQQLVDSEIVRERH